MRFKFALGDKVRLISTAACGEVIGRAQHSTGGDTYRVRYPAGRYLPGDEGKQVDEWQKEHELTFAS
jgi:hypothetical protein